MNGYWVRVLVALVLAAFLWAQSRGLRERPQRRRAFELAAAALVAVAGLNGSLALGADLGWLQVSLTIASIALFIGAVAALVLSLRAGEAGDQRTRIADAAREYRAQREARARKKDR